MALKVVITGNETKVIYVSGQKLDGILVTTVADPDVCPLWQGNYPLHKICTLLCTLFILQIVIFAHRVYTCSIDQYPDTVRISSFRLAFDGGTVSFAGRLSHKNGQLEMFQLQFPAWSLIGCKIRWRMKIRGINSISLDNAVLIQHAVTLESDTIRLRKINTADGTNNLRQFT